MVKIVSLKKTNNFICPLKPTSLTRISPLCKRALTDKPNKLVFVTHRHFQNLANSEIGEWYSAYLTPMQENNCLKLPQMSYLTPVLKK
jgi:hypothetical protein